MPASAGPPRALEVAASSSAAPRSSLRAAALGIPAIPGALTPSEVEHAWAAGAALVKLFPASLGGPRYVRDLLAPLADVPLLVTGGVDAGNARAFLDAGAVAVGIGSALEDDPRAVLRAVRR